jgi:hypothetical protein
MSLQSGSGSIETFVRRGTNRLTLRIPNNILDILKKDAKARDIPLNALVSKILSRDIAFQQKVNVIPSVTFPRVLLTRIIGEVNDDAIEQIAEEGTKLAKKLFAISGFEYNIDNVIEEYFYILGKYCGWYNFKYEIDGNRYQLVFEASATSRRYINLLLHFTKAILESLNVYIIRHSVTDNVVIFEVRK